MRDTWGISGPLFLLMFALLFAVTLGVVAMVRRGLATRAEARPERLAPEEVGYLGGGPMRAADTVLAGLFAQGLLGRSGTRGWVRATGTPAAAATELERAAYELYSGPREGDIGYGELRTRLCEEPAMGRLAHRLSQRGLLRTPGQRGRIGSVAMFCWVPLLTLGLIRLEEADGAPIGFLVVGMILAGVACVASACRVPHQTRAGRLALAALRGPGRDHAATDGRARFGPAGASMAVALFGVGALMLVDPLIADHVDAQRYVAAGGGSDGGGDWGDSGDGGDGGGCGGCGGGCGGCGG